MEKIVVCKLIDAEDKINKFLEDNWKVKMISNEFVSVATGSTMSSKEARGYVVFVLSTGI